MPLSRDDKVPQLRLTAVQYGILGIFLILVFGLWRLQVTGSDYYAQLAEKNRIRNIPILAPRGKILDREGRVIVDNYPSFSALLLRDATKSIWNDVPAIAAGLHMTTDEVRARLTNWRLSNRTATSCRSWKPSWRTAACTPRAASWRT